MLDFFVSWLFHQIKTYDTSLLPPLYHIMYPPVKLVKENRCCCNMGYLNRRKIYAYIHSKPKRVPNPIPSILIITDNVALFSKMQSVSIMSIITQLVLALPHGNGNKSWAVERL